jgi:hypothetical protein
MSTEVTSSARGDVSSDVQLKNEILIGEIFFIVLSLSNIPFHLIQYQKKMFAKITGSRKTVTAPSDAMAPAQADSKQGVRRAFGTDLTTTNIESKSTTGGGINKVHVHPAPSVATIAAAAAAPVAASDINLDVFDPASTAENDFGTTGTERSYMLRASDDIDVRDVDNPLLVGDYVNQMYDLFHVQERAMAVNAEYMQSQPFVNEKMRTILVDWLVSPLLLCPFPPMSTHSTHTSKYRRFLFLFIIIIHHFLFKIL